VEFGGNLPVTSAVIGEGGVIAAYGSMADAEPKLPFYPLMFRHATVRMLLVYLLSARERGAVVARLTAALEAGALHHAVAATFDLAESAKAHAAVESGRLIGNAVITIA
jgi:NADPH2:quinone reductase